MPSQVEVRSPATEMALDHPRDSSIKARYEQTKFLVKTNTLPAQKSTSKGDDQYTPLFSTEYARGLAYGRVPWSTQEFGRVLIGGGSFIAAPTTMLFGDPSIMPVTAGAAAVCAVIGAGLAGPVLTQLIRAKIFSAKLVKRMNQTSSRHFADWIKARYGIVEDEGNQRYNVNYTYLSTGVRDSERNYKFIDKLTGSTYKAHTSPEDRIYLTLVKAGSRPAEAPTTNQASVVDQVFPKTSAINQVPHTVKRNESSLPKKAAVLCEKLTDAITLLKEQGMTVEVKHQVERTENVVQTVVAKYQHITKLAALPQAEQDLLEFLDNQLIFINSLLREQAEELMKEMNVEMVAAMEATRVNHGMLEVQR
jgi:hypothetical protein